jgi:Tfp pilus assembly PilM family ATPase
MIRFEESPRMSLVSNPVNFMRFIKNMVGFFKNHTYPIGVDMGDDALTLAQMANGTGNLHLHACLSIKCPDSIEPGSPTWQKWAIEMITKSVCYGGFRGKNVIAAMPPREVFIDTIRTPRVPQAELQNAILNSMKPKLGVDPNDILMEYLQTNSENLLVMATDKTKLYKHLAIYEKARLKVVSISIWPLAVLNAYSHLWAKRMNQDDNPVMLLDIAQSYTNIIICDSANLYFAHSASVGSQNLKIDRMIDLLNSEMEMCRIRFRAIYQKPPLDRIIFVSGHALDTEIYTKIAKRAKMSAQIGDCFEAVGAVKFSNAGSENCTLHANWMTAMGLSLS